MPRTPRLDHPGARHHVMNRALRREDLFLEDEDCALFLDVVAEVPTRFGARVHGYALMPNHYHLMLEVPQGNLSEVMKHVGGVFTQAYNRRHGHDGPLFRGRYRNELVQSDAYWMHLLAYLHLNPVRARLVKHPGDCLWTSHNAYATPRFRPDWLSCDELIDLFGTRDALLGYVEDVRLGRREAPDGFDPEQFWTASATAEVPPVEPPRQRTAEEALDEVAALLELPVDSVLERPRGPTPNLGAWLAVWWLQRGAGQSQTAIARRLGVSRPRVSQLQRKLLDLAREDAEVRALMERLRTST